jgi:Ca2+-binding EF-hand superfamily protein
LDTNNDGVLSATELRRSSTRRTTSTAIPAAVRQELASRYASAFNVAFTLDANHDGEIQTMEIVNAVSSLKSLDANRDGELTADELQPATTATSASVLSE